MRDALSFSDFARQYGQKLVESGFIYFQIGAKTDINEESVSLQFIKLEGGLMYAAVIYNFNKITTEDFRKHKTEFYSFLENRREQLNIRSVIVLEVFATDKRKISEWEEINNSLASFNDEYFEQQLYTISYAVCLYNRELVCSKKQPYNILKMDMLIRSVLGSEPSSEQDARIGSISSPYLTPVRKNPALVYCIMLVNILFFAYMELNGTTTDTSTLLRFGALQRFYVFEEMQYYRILTAAFIHIGFTHLLYNSLSLYIFGTRVERHYGQVKFAIIYLLSGIAGNIVMLLISDAVSAGASGAIFGLAGATLAICLKTGKIVDGMNFQFMCLYIIIACLMGLVMPDVANGAHLGGLAAGFIFGYLLYNKKSR